MPPCVPQGCARAPWARRAARRRRASSATTSRTCGTRSSCAPPPQTRIRFGEEGGREGGRRCQSRAAHMLCCCAASQPAQRACSAPDRLGLLLSCRRRRRCERMLEYSKPAAERVHLLRRIATELDPKVERPLHRALPGGYAPPCRWLYPLPPSSRRWSCRCTASSSSNCSTTSTPRRATPQSPPSPHRHRTLPHTHTLLHARPSSTLATPPRSPLLHTRHAPTPPHPPPSTLAPAPPPHSAAPPPPPHFAPLLLLHT